MSAILPTSPRRPTVRCCGRSNPHATGAAHVLVRSGQLAEQTPPPTSLSDWMSGCPHGDDHAKVTNGRCGRPGAIAAIGSIGRRNRASWARLPSPRATSPAAPTWLASRKRASLISGHECAGARADTPTAQSPRESRGDQRVHAPHGQPTRPPRTTRLSLKRVLADGPKRPFFRQSFIA